MAPSYSVLVLDTAGRLDRELAVVRGFADQLAELLREDARAAFLSGALNAAMSTLRLLRRCMVDSIGTLQDVSIEVQEAALRARMNIVVRAVYFLHRGERDVPASALGGRFRSVSDVTTHLADHVSRILSQWLEQRAAGAQVDEASRRALRYAALDEAEVAFEALGRDPELSRFLRAGSESASELFRLSCLEIAATVGLAVTSAAPSIDAFEIGVPVRGAASR